ncbi:basic proline-rich protein-like [Canis lupus familiaris]|uniref:basic proline-rich protein-like n=1 Tax=Canis lupus familiaris TaxID=9615 RepID=UPI0018F6D059|nr:basic proline-rich protein-like [Canis lupus familiaris]
MDIGKAPETPGLALQGSAEAVREPTPPDARLPSSLAPPRLVWVPASTAGFKGKALLPLGSSLAPPSSPPNEIRQAARTTKQHSGRDPWVSEEREARGSPAEALRCLRLRRGSGWPRLHLPEAPGDPATGPISRSSAPQPRGSQGPAGAPPRAGAATKPVGRREMRGPRFPGPPQPSGGAGGEVRRNFWQKPPVAADGPAPPRPAPARPGPQTPPRPGPHAPAQVPRRPARHFAPAAVPARRRGARSLAPPSSLPPPPLLPLHGGRPEPRRAGAAPSPLPPPAPRGAQPAGLLAPAPGRRSGCGGAEPPCPGSPASPASPCPASAADVRRRP